MSKYLAFNRDKLRQNLSKRVRFSETVFSTDKHKSVADFAVNRGSGKRGKVNNTLFAFAVLSVSFIVGAIAGTLSGSAASSTVDTLDVINDSFTAAVLPLLLYPVLAVFLGLTIPGTLFLPLLSALRGFMLSFSIATVLPTLNAEATLQMLTSLTLPTLVSVTVFMILSTQAFIMSLSLLKLVLHNAPSGSGKLFPYHYRLTLIVCAVALTLLVLIIK